MRFSILVPVYNVENYLSQCIESVLKQDFEDYELILVNDGSTDRSPEICQEFTKKDSRIKYYSKENEGLLLTRRYSIKKASGDYLLFLDSDDFWEPSLLCEVEKAIQQTQADMIVFRFKRIRDNGQLIRNDVDIFPTDTLFSDDKELFIQKFVSSSRLNTIWSKCVKREIVDIDADYSGFKDKKGEDLLQSIALIRNAKSIFYLNRILYNYRLSPNGRGRNFKLTYLEDYEAVRHYILSNLLEMELSQETLQLFYLRYIEGLMGFMDSLTRCSHSLVEFKNTCERIRLFPTYSSASEQISVYSKGNKFRLNYVLFHNHLYCVLYLKCKFYNCIKSLYRCLKK